MIGKLNFCVLYGTILNNPLFQKLVSRTHNPHLPLSIQLNPSSLGQ